MKLSRILATAIATLWSASLLAANVTQTWEVKKELPLHIGGAFELENGAGNVEIVGHNEAKLLLTAVCVVEAVDQKSLLEGRAQTNVQLLGTNRALSARTLTPLLRNSAWTSTVHYTIRVPRTAHVKVTSGATKKVRVVNIIGNVTVKSFSGTMSLERISGATIAENTNGTIVFDPVEGLDANVQLSTINGNIIASVAPDSNFEWVAETIKGDFRTTIPGVRARFIDPNSLRAGVNAPGGPTLTTIALMGNVFLLRKGSRAQEAASVRTGVDIPAPPTNAQLPTYRYDQVQGQFVYSTTLGHIYIREVRGNARVATGAGEVRMGNVIGGAHVNSMGGPLVLGDVLGALTAHTEAGDVLINAAREGGTITTGGGIIRLLYTSGPTRLVSGGGDIFVRQAAAPINAETKSGDITITVQPTAKTMKVIAKTHNGSVLLNLSPKFGADIEAVVTTSDAANKIVSEIPGLEFRREQVGNRTRWRASGKINGGGEKIELTADEGGILITNRAGHPITVITPQ